MLRSSLMGALAIFTITGCSLDDAENHVANVEKYVLGIEDQDFQSSYTHICSEDEKRVVSEWLRDNKEEVEISQAESPTQTAGGYTLYELQNNGKEIRMPLLTHLRISSGLKTEDHEYKENIPMQEIERLKSIFLEYGVSIEGDLDDGADETTAP